MDRKHFFTTGALTTGICLVSPHILFAQKQEKSQLDKKVVQNFVGAGHKSMSTGTRIIGRTSYID